MLRGVSLALGEGDVTCLLGPNGAGKTTLIRTLLGIRREQRLANEGDRGLDDVVPFVDASKEHATEVNRPDAVVDLLEADGMLLSALAMNSSRLLRRMAPAFVTRLLPLYWLANAPLAVPAFVWAYLRGEALSA